MTCAEGPDIVCTLDTAEVGDRVADWRAVLAQAVGRTPLDGGIHLAFPPDAAIAAEVARLAAAEHACCAFFDFTIRLTASGTALEVHAPAEAQPLLDDLFGAVPEPRPDREQSGG